MPMSSTIRPLVVLLLGAVSAATLAAQDLAQASPNRTPRFLLETARDKTLLDVARTPVLRHRLSLDLADASIGAALAAISAQTGLRFVYSKDALPAGTRVHLRVDDISVAAALTEILLDSGLDVLLERSGQVALVKRPPAT